MRPMTQPPPPGSLPPGYPAYPPLPKHPQAMTVLILGILGLLVCGLIGPFAWSMGNRVVHEIETSGGRWGGESEATIGRILGIVSTALLVLTLVLLFAMIAFSGVMFGGFVLGT